LNSCQYTPVDFDRVDVQSGMEQWRIWEVLITLIGPALPYKFQLLSAYESYFSQLIYDLASLLDEMRHNQQIYELH
jgi:hypothetical protein